MTPTIMRLFWELVNQSLPSYILRLDDEGLLHWLIDEVRQRLLLDGNQETALSNYISDRLPLIRDIVTEEVYSPERVHS